MQAFETKSVTMQRKLLVSVQTPPEDVDRIMLAVAAITPLAQGKYDSNAFQSAPGIERYRPRQGAVAGEEDAIRKRPGVVEVEFQMEDDPDILYRVVEAIFQVHCYQEPVITVREVLSSLSKGLDDTANPHRWWNTTGDWKTNSARAMASSASDA